MSRGPGKRQAAIEALMTPDYDDIYVLEDFAAAAFPGLNRMEKKHAVATARAAKAACERCGWDWGRKQSRGGSLSFFNKRSVRSYGLFRAWAGASIWSGDLAAVRAAVEGTGKEAWRPWAERARQAMEPGGAWFVHVMQWRAELDGDDAAKAEVAEMTRELNRQTVAAMRALMARAVRR